MNVWATGEAGWPNTLNTRSRRPTRRQANTAASTANTSASSAPGVWIRAPRPPKASTPCTPRVPQAITLHRVYAMRGHDAVMIYSLSAGAAELLPALPVLWLMS